MIAEDEDEIINSIELLNLEQENDFFGFEASKRKVISIQENNIDAKIKYAADRLFINNGDSYHGKFIIQEMSEVQWHSTTLFNNAEVDNNKTLENNVSNDENDGRELNNYKELQQDQNVTLMNNDVDKEKEEKEISDDVYARGPQENDVAVVELQPVNNETPFINTRRASIANNNENERYKYDIVTTVTKKSHIYNEKYKHLRNLKKIIIPGNKRSLMNEIKKCAIVVYDISLDRDQIAEAYAALQKITEEINLFKNRPPSVAAEHRGVRAFILVSTLLTWGLTEKQNEIPMTQADYRRRVCHPNYRDHYDLENYLLLLNDKYRGYFHGIVFAPGLAYGRGEHALKYVYEAAFSDAEQLPIPKRDNRLPIIHVKKLAEAVKDLAGRYDKLAEPYVVGVETNRYSLRNVTEAIKNEVQKKDFVYCDYSGLFQNAMVTQTVYDTVTMSIDLVPYSDNNITQFLLSDKSAPRMFTDTATLISEYLKTKPKMKKIIINGPHEIKEFAKKLARTYELDYIDPVTISEEFLNLLENSFENNDTYVWLEYFVNNGFANQTPTTLPNTNSTISLKPSSKLDNKNLFKEQKKYFDEKGQISDKYLLPFMKYQLSKNRRKKYGYIMSNFPETVKQAKSLFDLEAFVSKNENANIFAIDIYPTIIVDVIMVGKNLMNKVTRTSSTGRSDDRDAKPLRNADSDKLHGWLSLGSKYAEDEIVERILENDNVEIRKNRTLVDYLEELLKPKVFKEYILITEENFATISPERFDGLYESILTCFPAKPKAEDEASCVRDKTIVDNGIVCDAHQQAIITNIKLEKENDGNNPVRLLKDGTDKTDSPVSPENATAINFLAKCVNPVLVKGIMEIIRKPPKDPVDALAEYIYDQNMRNSCVSAPPKTNLKARNSFNKHML